MIEMLKRERILVLPINALCVHVVYGSRSRLASTD